ncbi:MAG: hypothetical protein RR540_03350 [Oscillospiraceae bacterium]
MLLENLVIFGIIFAIMIIYLRTKREYAIAVAPLLTLPAVNIIVYFVTNSIVTVTPFFHIIFNIIAVVLSSAAVGFCSVKFKTKSAKLAYVGMCIAFNLLLAIIILENLYGYLLR